MISTYFHAFKGRHKVDVHMQKVNPVDCHCENDQFCHINDQTNDKECRKFEKLGTGDPWIEVGSYEIPNSYRERFECLRHF